MPSLRRWRVNKIRVLTLDPGAIAIAMIVFAQMDSSGDGNLNFNEFLKLMRSPLSESQVEECKPDQSQHELMSLFRFSIDAKVTWKTAKAKQSTQRTCHLLAAGRGSQQVVAICMMNAQRSPWRKSTSWISCPSPVTRFGTSVRSSSNTFARPEFGSRLEARASLQLQLWSDCGGKSWKLVELFCIFEPDEEDMKLQATGTTYLVQCCLA